MIQAARVPTPLGAFLVVVDGDTVVASTWRQSTDERLLQAFGFDSAAVRLRRDLGPATAAVRAFFKGDVSAIDAVAVRQVQPPFTARALDVLREIPAGTVVTYTQLAALAGNPRAIRAAGTACARNDIPLFVPCHRVIASGGSLGGFGFGLDAKRMLLEHERRAVQAVAS